jgi:hypothetical protein
MAGSKALRRLQLGRETTAGTAVPATAVWRGLGTIEDQREIKFADEDVGLLSRTDRSYCAKLLASLQMEEVEATYEQLPYIFEGGIKLVNTGATDTGGSGKVYVYAVATNAKPTIRTFTIEGGDDQQAEEMEHAFVESFRLSASAGEALKVTANWLGRQVSTSTFTAPLSLPTVEEILSSKAVIFLDATTIGTTTASNTVLGFDIDVKTGLTPRWTHDGALYFSGVEQNEPEITATVTFEHDATAVAEKAAWRSGTRRLVRINISGSALTTAGTFTYKTLRIDGGGKWEKFEKIGERDGNDIVTGTLRFRPDSTGANFATFTVVNETAVVP